MKHFAPRHCLLLLLAGSITFSGCFVEKYEARLKQTVALFKHDQLLNENLDNVWNAYGVSLRVPVSYAVMAPPPPEPEAKPDAPRRPVLKQVDKRQPAYLKTELPGLLGAWESKVRTPAGDAPAYLYLLGNQFFLAAGESGSNKIAPDKFQAEVLKKLTEVLSVKLAEKDWRQEELPREPIVSDYLPRVNYLSTVLEPPNPVAGRRLRFRTYTHTAGDIQLILLFVIPADVDNSDRLYQQFDMCLETLRVEPSSFAAKTAISAPSQPSADPKSPKPAQAPPGAGF